MRVAILAFAVLAAVGLLAVPEALETLTGEAMPGVVGEAQAVVCIEEIRSCCSDPVSRKLGINC